MSKSKKAPPKAKAKAQAPAKAKSVQRQRPEIIDRRPEIIDRAFAKIVDEPQPSASRQIEIPGTEQVRDEVIEAAWRDRKAAEDAIKDGRALKAQAEVVIETRFRDIALEDPEDPRARAYRVEDGEVLTPKTKFKLGVQRAPSDADKAKRKRKQDDGVEIDEASE